jgi:hypothetical protein
VQDVINPNVFLCFIVCRMFILPWYNNYIYLTSFCNIGINNSTDRSKCKSCLIFTLPLVKQLWISQRKQVKLCYLPSSSCGSDSNTNVVIFLCGVFGISLIVELHNPKCWLVYVSIWSAVPIVGLSVSVSHHDVFDSWQIVLRCHFYRHHYSYTFSPCNFARDGKIVWDKQMRI